MTEAQATEMLAQLVTMNAHLAQLTEALPKIGWALSELCLTAGWLLGFALLRLTFLFKNQREIW